MFSRSLSNILSGTAYQYLAGFACALGTFVFGTSFGWSSPASSQLKGSDNGFEVSSFQFGWVASTLNLGSAVSCLLIGQMMNKFGRRNAMLLIIIPLMIGWILIIFAQNFTMLLIGRFLCGAGGAFFISCPQYTTEIAEVKIRGTLGTFAQLFFTIGILFAYVVGAFVKLLWMNIICGVTPLIFGIIFYFMPETPSYLFSQNEDAAGIASLKKLRGNNLDLQQQIEEIKSEISKQKTGSTSLKQLFKDKATIKACIISAGLVFFLQMSGINAVLFYTKDIFDTAGVGLSSDDSSILVGAINMLATFLATLIIDKTGRKVLLLISSIFMTICLFSLGLFFFLKNSDPDSTTNLGWLPLTALSIFAVAFSIGFGPIPWVIFSEIFSYDVKTIASPLVGTLSWTFGFIVTNTFDIFEEMIGTGPNFWIFTGLSALGAVFVAVLVPETKNVTLSDIQKKLSK